MLDYLKPNYSLHIITNGFEEVQHEKIRTSGLLLDFTHLSTPHRAPEPNPNPNLYLFSITRTKALVAVRVLGGRVLYSTGKERVGGGMCWFLQT